MGLPPVNNGSYLASVGDSSRIGLGTARAGGFSVVETIHIENGVFQSYTYWGGWVDGDGECLIRKLEILNGTYVATNGDSGSGIGAGYVDGGTVEITQLIIRDGEFRGGGYSGAGIGSGWALRGGKSYVRGPELLGGAFAFTASSAAGIGTGYYETNGESVIDKIHIGSGSFVLTSNEGSAIGREAIVVDSGQINVTDGHWRSWVKEYWRWRDCDCRRKCDCGSSRECDWRRKYSELQWSVE
jgi:hypothetical protein